MMKPPCKTIMPTFDVDLPQEPVSICSRGEEALLFLLHVRFLFPLTHDHFILRNMKWGDFSNNVYPSVYGACADPGVVFTSSRTAYLLERN